MADSWFSSADNMQYIHHTLEKQFILALKGNQIFMSLYATARLEGLSLKKGLNKFALKAKLYIKATQKAFEQLQIPRSETA